MSKADKEFMAAMELQTRRRNDIEAGRRELFGQLLDNQHLAQALTDLAELLEQSPAVSALYKQPATKGAA